VEKKKKGKKANAIGLSSIPAAAIGGGEKDGEYGVPDPCFQGWERKKKKASGIILVIKEKEGQKRDVSPPIRGTYGEGQGEKKRGGKKAKNSSNIFFLRD